MEAFLESVLPKIVAEMSYQIYNYQCKQQLIERPPQRLQGYARWLPDNWRIIVILDRDNDDCKELKQDLDDIAADAGIITRSRNTDEYHIVNRLAIEELEAWYFGDWQAVKSAYPRVSERVPRRRGYRNPDKIKGGTWEAFERLLQASGYFGGGLAKIEAARTISEYISPERNTSHSFQTLKSVLEEVIAGD